ncbi:peptidylprolyl isomerase [Ferruginibacter sp.]
MTRLIITTILFLFYSFTFGQSKGNDISKIKTVSEAEAFISKNPQTGSKLFTIESSNDTTEILMPLYNKKIGFTFYIDNIAFKILSIDSTLSFRVNYIYLNGDKFSKLQLDSLRQEIISKFKTGTSFFDLVQQYNMDGNFTGDTKWFTENMMVKNFEQAVRNHKKNEIFTVDTPEQNWYHVVLKTFDDTYIKKVTLLKMKSSNQN